MTRNGFWLDRPVFVTGATGLIGGWLVRRLLDAGADPNIRDDKYEATVLGWAEFCAQPEIADLLRRRAATT